MNDRFYGVANRGAEIEFHLVAGQKYILETSQKNCGMAEVYDLNGNYLKDAQTDDFDNWVRVES